MSVKETLTNFASRATDLVVNAKVTFEKGCVEIVCLSLKDLRESKVVKGIIDYDNKIIQFSGVLDVVCKDIAKPWIFIAPGSEVFELDLTSIKQETTEVTLKTKTENHVVTTVNYVPKTIVLN